MKTPGERLARGLDVLYAQLQQERYAALDSQVERVRALGKADGIDYAIDLLDALRRQYHIDLRTFAASAADR